MKDKSKIYQMAIIVVMTAVICILGPLSIPIGLIPISLTNFAILLVLYVLGMKKGTLSCILYLLIGLIGLPVFSGFSSGPGKLLGPTGGFLIGYIFMTLISGFFIDRFMDKWYLCFIGMILGTSVLYAFGTTWLAYQANMTAKAALVEAVLPFIAWDVTKIAIVSVFGPQLRKRLINSSSTRVNKKR
ncbi:MAG: biotin transporter BioY [Clostridiales bacterium]|nr:biotin transporter BioY [Clostridiales bacterium]